MANPTARYAAAVRTFQSLVARGNATAAEYQAALAEAEAARRAIAALCETEDERNLLRHVRLKHFSAECRTK